jgi:hypothetical protein
LLALKPSMKTWVPHILCYVVPRQMVLLGAPSRRSCDACESLGARIKKIIKFSTCRRRTTSHTNQGCWWKQTFTKGYVEQAFSRICVSEQLRHGEENAPFLQRVDVQRRLTGKGGKPKLTYVQRVWHSIKEAVRVESVWQKRRR